MKVSDHPAARSRAQQPETELPRVVEEHSEDGAAVTITRTEAVLAADVDRALYDGPTPPQPTRDPIVTAPRDGRDVRVYWGTEDETGRLARWHEGRRFNRRRWVMGGSWIPADGLALGMIPLPAAEPTEWLHDPSADPPPDAEEDAEQAAA